MNNCNEFLSESKTDIVLGQTTCSSKNDANLIAQGLLNKQLVACAQIEGPISSRYIWKGKIEQSVEWKITLKFNEDNINPVTESLTKLHPYENPEWVYWKAQSTAKYANWVDNPK
jgi:periplasmic divalent cation tolerance protein